MKDTRDLRHIEQVVHPDYLHWLEHVFQNLARPFVAAVDRRDSTDLLNQGLPEWLDGLGKHGLGDLKTGYHRNVRNALSHGGVNYRESDIQYVDRGGEAFLTPRELGALHDNLVDSCSSLLAALLLYLERHETGFSPTLRRSLPLALYFLRLQALHKYPGFELERLAESTTANGRRQLLIFGSSETDSRRHHVFDCLCLAALATAPVRGRYQRIGIVVDSKRPVTGAWFVPAAPIEKAYAENSPISSLQGKLDEGMLLWHDTNRISSMLFSLRQVGKLALHKGISEWKRQMAELPDTKQADGYWVKLAQEEPAGNYRRWFVHAIVPNSASWSKEKLENIAWRLHIPYLMKPMRAFNMTKRTGLPLPPSEVIITLYSEDQRMRNLKLPHDGKTRRLLVRRFTAPLAASKGKPAED